VITLKEQTKFLLRLLNDKPLTQHEIDKGLELGVLRRTDKHEH